MIEVLIILIGGLLTGTIVASLEYYKHVREAKKEYEKAREAVEDIVLSFNRELKREAERLELIAYKVEASTAKSNSSLKRVENIENKITPIDNRVKEIIEKDENVLSKISEIKNKNSNFEAEQQTLKIKIIELEGKLQKLAEVPEIKSQPVIPIRRDKALGALTDTEVIVLEMLSIEGPKTAPEIKDRVQLSREHTSRLMKKLYEKGYLERETGKIPFSYRIKEEMKNFLNKSETKHI